MDKEKINFKLYFCTLSLRTPSGIPESTDIRNIFYDIDEDSVYFKLLDETGIFTIYMNDKLYIYGVTYLLTLNWASGYIAAHYVTTLMPNRSLQLHTLN